MKSKLAEILFQIIPVMIGVYLGFVVSNWGESQKSKAKSKALIDNILSEIGDNKKRVEMVYPYHIALRDTTGYFTRTKDFSNRFNFEGTRIVTLSRSAYETGIQTGIINELPLDVIQSLNQLYTYQISYNDFRNTTMAALLTKEFTEEPENLLKIAIFLNLTMNDVVYMEEALLKAFENAEKDLQKIKK